MTNGIGIKEEQRKVAFLIHDLRDGGAERITVSLANGIAARGFQVDLVLVNEKGKQSYFESIAPSVTVRSLKQTRTLTSAFGFRDYFNDANPDVVISALTHINISAIIGRMLARSKPRLVVVEHNQMSKNIGRKKGFVRLAYAAVPRVYRLADLIGVVSEGVKSDFVDLTGIPAGRVEVLYNPVVTPELQKQSREEPDHPWFQEGEPPVILGIGRLTEQKNFPMLIESFASLRKNRDARLIFLGQGPDLDELEAQAKATGFGDDIAFPGFVDNPFAYMSGAAVVALSSNWEGLPTVLIEAMACGTPVVSTDCPSGPSEILRNGELAPLTPVGDALAFTKSLHDVLDRNPDVNRLIARASEFSLDAAVDRYLQVAFPNETVSPSQQMPVSSAA